MDIPETKSEVVSSKGHKSNFKAYLLYASALCLGLFVANMFFNFITKSTKRNIENLAAKTTQKYSRKIEIAPTLQADMAMPTEISKISEPQAPLKKPAQYQSSLIVNGIFLSQGKQRYALINNHIVKEGDTIEGLKVIRITLEGLELESPEGPIIKLAK
ncbi:MAG: hypothetical protein NTW64_00970 [Candidatus Omnitrophica bacterium]|nr:hypothetical protein [Candidatus Omnitrophota bacterium]